MLVRAARRASPRRPRRRAGRGEGVDLAGKGPVLQRSSSAPIRTPAGQHRGIDIGAGAGEPVLAPAAGVVSFAGTVPIGGGQSRSRRLTATPSRCRISVRDRRRRGAVVAEGDASAGRPERGGRAGRPVRPPRRPRRRRSERLHRSAPVPAAARAAAPAPSRAAGAGPGAADRACAPAVAPAPVRRSAPPAGAPPVPDRDPRRLGRAARTLAAAVRRPRRSGSGAVEALPVARRASATAARVPCCAARRSAPPGPSAGRSGSGRTTASSAPATAARRARRPHRGRSAAFAVSPRPGRTRSSAAERPGRPPLPASLVAGIVAALLAAAPRAACAVPRRRQHGSLVSLTRCATT